MRKTLAAATLLLLIGAPARAATITVGLGAGGTPLVTQFDETGAKTRAFLAFDPAFQGGVRVAVGDVNGDGTPDVIAAAGPGDGPHVKVFDGVTGVVIRSFFAFGTGFTGGVFVAAGDINGDGKAEIVVGADAGGGPHVKVFDGASGAEALSFFAYDPGFTGGVRVAVGDVNGDKTPEILTGAGPGGSPHVKVFDGSTAVLMKSFFAFDPSFTGGVFVAAGDINGDGADDLVIGADAGGAPQVSVFDGVSNATLRSFLVSDPAFRGGVRVAAADVNGDGLAEVITGAGPGGAPVVNVFDGKSGTQLSSLFAASAQFTGGIYVAGSSAAPVGPEQSLTALVTTVSASFKPGAGLLQNALRNLTSGDAQSTCNMLIAFTNEVNAQTGKSVSVSDAAKLTESAATIYQTLGCR